MKKGQYMIQDKPELVKFFTSRSLSHLLLLVLPLVLGSLVLTLSSSASVILVALVILTGAVYWTFLEYVIHRFVYHTHFKNSWLNYFVGSFHLYHHMDMSDRRVLNAGFLMIYVLTPVIVSPALLFTRDPSLLGALVLGIALAYAFYESVHFLLHYRHHETGYFGYIQKYHMYHHDLAPKRNFGNTSHFWDLVFGTYDDRYQDHAMNEETRATLISTLHEESSHARPARH